MTPNPAGPPILIIEDDPNIAELVSRYLENSGFQSVMANDGEEGVAAARRYNPQLVVLDIMLPKLDGWEVCRVLRRESDVPIIMLTAREDEMDRVVGFSMGADDYVVKPFSPRELVERVKAILRRTRPADATVASDKPLCCGPLMLEPEKHKLTRDGEQVTLTPSEYKLLHCLMASPGRVYSRSELLERLYENGEAVIDRVVDVHIGKLRQKIESDPSKPVLIRTVHGIGYRFDEDSGRD